MFSARLRGLALEGMASHGKSGWLATLSRTAAEFRQDNLSDWAAALTYYGLLSLFPGLIALVSIVGLVGDPRGTTRTITTRAGLPFCGWFIFVPRVNRAIKMAIIIGIGMATCEAGVLFPFTTQI